MNSTTKQPLIIKDVVLNVETMSNINLLVNAISNIMNVSIAFVSTIGAGEHITISGIGIERFSGEETEFSELVVEKHLPVVIEDLDKTKEFESLKMFSSQPRLRFICGFPISNEDSVTGVLVLADTKPKKITENDLNNIKSICQLIFNKLHFGSKYEHLLRDRGVIDVSPILQITWTFQNGPKLSYVSANSARIIGTPSEKLLSGSISFEDILSQESIDEFSKTLNYHSEGAKNLTCQLCIKNVVDDMWMSMLSSAVFSENGTLEAVHAFLFDTSDQKYIEDRLHTTNQRMRLLLEASELGTWDWNIAADVNQVNSRWCSMIGISIEDYDPGSRFFRQKLHPADISNVDECMDRHLSGESEVFNVQFRMRHSDNRWVWIETYGKIVEYDSVGAPIRVAGIHRDITERMESEIKTKKKTQLLSFINKARENYQQNNDLTAACQSILSELIDLSDSQFAFIGEIQSFQEKERLFIHAISDISWDNTSSQLVERYRNRDLYFESFDNLFGQVIVTGEQVVSNIPAKHPSSKGTPKGHPRINRFLGLPIKQKDKTVGMIGLANKASAYDQEDAQFLQPLIDALAGLFYAVELERLRAEAEDKLREMAMTDPLTSLANRRSFLEKSKYIENNSQNCIVAIIDIDHFKRVNDTYGHDAGDVVIVTVANKLKEICRTDDFVARLGGEEFSILLTNSSKEAANDTLNRMRTDIEKTSISYKKEKISVTVSIGATAADSWKGSSIAEQLNEADKALYDAKNSGRNKVCWQ